MKRTAMLALILILLTGCGKEKGPEKIVLKYAAQSTETVLPEDFYPRFLAGNAVMGTGGEGLVWYDGESHTAEIHNAMASCPIDGGAAAVVTSYENGEPVTSVRFVTEEGESTCPILFGSYTTDEIGGITPEILGLYPADMGVTLITPNEIITAAPDGIRHRQSVKQVISVNHCPDGVCVLAYDDVADRHVYLLNGDGTLNEVKLTLPDKAMTAFFLMDGEGYYADDEGIFTLAGQWIMSFSQSGWLADGISAIRMDGEDAFTILGTHAGSGEYGVYQMKKSAETTERILVDAVYDPYAGEKIPEAAAMFNVISEEYFVRCTELAPSEGSLSALERILLADDIPDLAVMEEGTPLDDYINKEVFRDLSAYFGTDSIMNCARDALERDGKLYTVSAGFTVRTFSGQGDYLPDLWTYDDLFALHDSLGENQRMLQSGTYTTDLLNGAGSLIDGEIIDMETLAKLFELLSRESEVQIKPGRFTDTEPFVTGQVLLKNAAVNSVDTYVQMKAYAGWEEPYIIGYPSASGGVHRIEFDNRIGIFTDGDCPDGAAAFIEYLIHTYPITEAGRDFCSIPTSNACWDGWIGLLQSSGIVYAFEPGSGDWWPHSSGDPEDWIVVEPDDALCNEFRGWLNGITPAEPIPDQVYAILTEELSAVKSGSVSAEDAAERAAGRIRLYLSEKS